LQNVSRKKNDATTPKNVAPKNAKKVVFFFFNVRTPP